MVMKQRNDTWVDKGPVRIVRDIKIGLTDLPAPHGWMAESSGKKPIPAVVSVV